jgi:hypothetical protein
VKKTTLIPLALSLFTVLSAYACGNLVDGTRVDGAKSRKDGAAAQDSGSYVDAGSVTLVRLAGSLGGPPRYYGEDGSVEAYYWEYDFYPDGRVEYTERSYDKDVLHNESWQKSAEGFTELLAYLNEAGYFSLPESFSYGPFDAGTATLLIYAGEECYFSSYGPSFDEEDTASFAVVIACQNAFRQLTKKPFDGADAIAIALMLNVDADTYEEIRFSPDGWVNHYTRSVSTDLPVAYDYWQVDTGNFDELVRILFDSGVASGVADSPNNSAYAEAGGIKLAIFTARDLYEYGSVPSGDAQDAEAYGILVLCRDEVIRLTRNG